MRPYEYVMGLIYVMIICKVNGILLKFKESFRTIQNDEQTTIRCVKLESKKNKSTKSAKNSLRCKYRRSAQLYLNEKYLRVAKLADPFADSKSIVDRATKRPLELVLNDLDDLDERDLSSIRIFVEKNFHAPGIEIVNAKLTEWSSRPIFLENIRDERLRQFSAHLNETWLHLCKRYDPSVLGHGCVSSHLEMKHSFVVPGGRFREIYYWDTYWTLEGLFVCGLFETARNILENFIQFIDTYGFIPNGSRIYYLNRSQPPYFCQMVERYMQTCQDPRAEKFVLDEALPRMISEYEFWMRKRSVPVRLSSSNKSSSSSSRVYRLNRYKVDTGRPRPESYHEDLVTGCFFFFY